MDKKPLIERKWLVLIGSTLVLMSLFGVVNNSYQLYIIPVCDDLGFSRTSYTFTQSVCYFGAMISAALSVNVFKRFGVLGTLRAAVILLMALYCCNSLVSSLPLFYIIGFAEGLLMGVSCMIPISMILKQWFSDKLGLAVGLASMGSGLGGLVFSQVAKIVLLNSNWRHLYIVLGLIMGLISIVSVFILLRENPNAQLQLPQKKSNTSSSDPFPIFATILIFICTVIHSLGNNTILYTTTPFVQDVGFSLRFAANLSSITMGVFALGKVLTGHFIDRLGIRKPAIISFIAIVLGSLGLALLPELGLFMLILMLIGVFAGCPFDSIGMSVMSRYTVSENYRDKATGIYIAGVNLGCALSPLLSSAVYDNIGSYVPMYYATAAAVFISMLVIMKVIPGKRQA